MGAHPLLELSEARTDDVEAFLRQVREVFVVFRGHDSNNTSAGVLAEGRRWFVKWATEPEAVGHLRSAVRFHAAVRHPAIAALRNWFTIPSGLALVHEWVPGEVLNDPRAPGGLPRHDSRSAFSRFRRLAVVQILAAFSTVLDAHLAAARHGFVAVDFYDGCLIYDFRRQILSLCDLDSYRPGPYILDRDRQYGSTHFMAPEEFRRGAVIDERSTVFTLGRAALMLLSGPHGERDPGLWRAGDRAYQVAKMATEPDPAQRYQTVAAMTAAWHAAIAG